MELLIGAGIAAVTILAVVVIAAYERQELRKDFAVERQGWIEERRELITRIQRPEMVPARGAKTRVTSNLSDEQRRLLNQVGHVAPQVANAD